MEYRKNLEQELKKQELKKRVQVLNQIKKHSILNLAATSEGRIFLYFMMRDCGFGESSLCYDDKNNVIHDAVVVNEALRNYYLGIRKLIPKELLKEIEFLDIDAEITRQLEKEKKNVR